MDALHSPSRHALQMELRVAEDIGAESWPEIEPEMERYATMLMMDTIDRDPDVYYIKQDGKLGTVWSNSNFAMEVQTYSKPPHHYFPLLADHLILMLSDWNVHENGQSAD